jgi:DNA-binding NtrC family response regulator
MLPRNRAAIVEHDASMIALYRAAAKLAGYEVVGIARDASTALKMVRAERPSVLLVDFRLAGKSDGLDLIAAVKQLQPEICAVLITAVALLDLAEKIELVRPDRTLQKPFMLRSLLEQFPAPEPRAVPRSGTL